MKTELSVFRRDCEFGRVPAALRRRFETGCGSRTRSPRGARRPDLLLAAGHGAPAAVITFAGLLSGPSHRGLSLA